MKIFTNESIELVQGVLWEAGSQIKTFITLYSEVEREVVEDLKDGIDGLSLSYIYEDKHLVIKITEKTDTDAYPVEKNIGLFLNSEYGFDISLGIDNNEVVLNKVFKDYIPGKTCQASIIELKDDSNKISVEVATYKNATESEIYILTDAGWEIVEKWELYVDEDFTTILDDEEPESIEETPE